MSELVDCGGGVRLERGVPCRMSDGVTLYADHYYPPGDDPQPTLLMRQPYGSDIASTVVYAHPAWFARHGYNVVIQDVRGRGKSEGSFYPFRHEARDGAETIVALRRRPEADGRVGMYGFSYQGMTQLLAASEQPPGLVCISPAMTAHDLYHGWFYSNGALRLASTLGWGLQMLREDARRLGLRAASSALESAWTNLPAQYQITPIAEHPVLSSAGLPTYLADWMEHASPGAYWSALDISTLVDKIQVPAFHISGWYDTYLQGSVDGFLALSAGAGSAHARQHQYLLAGPWVHIPWGDRAGGLPLGDAANVDTDSLLLQWFDHWLRDTGAWREQPRIRHYALGYGGWFDADTFAKPSLALYLHSKGRANSRKGDGSLDSTRPAGEPPDLYIHDPEVPVAAPGGAANLAGPANQSQLELGNHLLTYTTAPLDAPLHLFGAVQASVYASTSSAQVDLVLKLICVREGGEAVFICIGIARSSYLFPSAYAADREQRWQFSLEPTSYLFAPGERLRLEIASSAFPLFDRNSGTEIAPRLADASSWQRSTQIIFHDADRPSAIHLPVLDRSAG